MCGNSEYSICLIYVNSTLQIAFTHTHIYIYVNVCAYLVKHANTQAHNYIYLLRLGIILFSKRIVFHQWLFSVRW